MPGWIAYLELKEERAQVRLVEAFTVALTDVLSQLFKKE
jgi:hypothetical protein